MGFGVIIESSPGYTAALAAEIEILALTFCYALTHKTFAPDPAGRLSLASKSTSKLHLGTGVINPITRDVSVVACSMMTLHLESGGRAAKGILRQPTQALKIVQHLSRNSLSWISKTM